MWSPGLHPDSTVAWQGGSHLHASRPYGEVKEALLPAIAFLVQGWAQESCLQAPAMVQPLSPQIPSHPVLSRSSTPVRPRGPKPKFRLC